MSDICPCLGDAILPQIDVAGKPTQIAIVGDVHMCSKYHLRAQFEDFCRKAYKRGVRYFLQVGDMLDGAYDHGQFELTHSGFEDQSEYCVKYLPEMPGAKWTMIAGNHDESLGKNQSLNVGRALEARFVAAGRKDFACVGARAADVCIAKKTTGLARPPVAPEEGRRLRPDLRRAKLHPGLATRAQA